MERDQIGPFAVHGGRLDLARVHFPEVTCWFDLSTGLAPWSYLARWEQDWIERLPDPAALTALEASAARYFGAPAEAVVAVPGSDVALRLLGALLPGRAAVARPGYSGHVAMWGGRDVLPVSADTLAIEDADTLVLARPGNPDGAIADAAALERTAATLAARGGHLIVDEAFADMIPDASLAASGWPGLIVLRSFGKFFGLAGLRLGFVIAPPAIVAGLRQLLGDWPVSGPAVAIGSIAYADTAWHAAQRARIAEGAARLDALLAGAGLAIVGGTPLFRLVETPARDALFRHLATGGLLTRPFADAPTRLRLGLPGSERAWARLHHALDTWRL
ncbi:aminotransferase class I/II-fold pyridoxal phosphate-dependent enzyme [Sphingomonas sp. CJ20]